MMNILVLCDDAYHPAHVVRAGLSLLAGYTFDFIEDATAWDAERLALYPAAIVAKSNNASSTNHTPWMTDPVQEAFRQYARQGHGLLFIHSGTAGYLDLPVIRGVIGGAFVKHPPRCPVTIEPKAGHFLTVGVERFTVEDEHYHMALDDPQADIFLTTHSEHGAQPGGWVRREGQGRVCVQTPGHTQGVWTHPAFQTLLRNALTWCLGKE